MAPRQPRSQPRRPATTDMTPIRSAGGQFLPGRSGNPAGRPRGSRNRSTLLAEMIDEDVSEEIVLKVVARALAGE